LAGVDNQLPIQQLGIFVCADQKFESEPFENELVVHFNPFQDQEVVKLTQEAIICGQKDLFAIDCTLIGRTDTPARKPMGEVWFWVGGIEIGDPDIISLPGIAENELLLTLRWCDCRNDPILFYSSTAQSLDVIYAGSYETLTEVSGTETPWDRFLVCMRPGAYEYLDGWFTVLLENPGSDTSQLDRFLVRRLGSPDQEVLLPTSLYKEVVNELSAWYRLKEKTFEAA